MSYILDALKKSDKQRDQEHIPDLNTVQIEFPPGKRKKTAWHLPLAALVLVNVIVILFLFLRQDQSATETQAVVNNSDSSQPEIVLEKQRDIVPQSLPGLSPVSQEPRPTDLVASVAKDRAENKITSNNNIAGEQGEAHVETDPEPQENGYAETAQEIVPEVTSTIVPQEDFDIASERESAEAATPSEEYFENPEQDQSQQTLLAAPAHSSFMEPKASLAKNALHIYQLPEVVRAQLPKIHIDAHLFYKDKPASRFASINGKIMREGYLLAPDLKVAEISTDGVVFSYQKYLFYVSVF